MDPIRFACLRPYLYHLTARANLASILQSGGIDSASELIRRAGRADLLTQRRSEHIVLVVDGSPISLRDQAPLHQGNIRLEGGFDFSGLVRHLNDRVFFWPGGDKAPIAYGLRHFARYAQEDCVVLVVPTPAAFDASPAEFCRYNSGSPRFSRGVPSPRGPNTFLPAAQFDGRASDVVEVTFPRRFPLPSASVRIAEPREWI